MEKEQKKEKVGDTKVLKGGAPMTEGK